jgi:hypothetical protein
MRTSTAVRGQERQEWKARKGERNLNFGGWEMYTWNSFPLMISLDKSLHFSAAQCYSQLKKQWQQKQGSNASDTAGGAGLLIQKSNQNIKLQGTVQRVTDTLL